MRCTKCHKEIPKNEQEFMKDQWIINIQKKQIGNVVVNKVPVPSKMLKNLKNRKGTIVNYCQKCLQEKLMEYIFNGL